MLALPASLQQVMYDGRQRAKAYLQKLHWDTRREMTKGAVQEVYSILEGEESGTRKASIMSHYDKIAEADQRLEEA